MSTLKTDYKDDVFTGKRKYNQVNNADGTVSFDDVTEYAQVGDSYGAAEINEVNEIVNNLDSKSYKSTDAAETSIADNDYFPFFDTSASAIKKSLWSNIKNVLTNVFAIKNHASNTTAYGTGNANLYGHVKLSDNYASSAGAAAAAVGASSKAVNDAYKANKNSISALSGTVSTNATTETTHYNELKGELTANSKRIYMDYKNGKYGINTSANRGADTFIPFRSALKISKFGKDYRTQTSPENMNVTARLEIPNDNYKSLTIGSITLDDSSSTNACYVYADSTLITQIAGTFNIPSCSKIIFLANAYGQESLAYFNNIVIE